MRKYHIFKKGVGVYEEEISEDVRSFDGDRHYFSDWK